MLRFITLFVLAIAPAAHALEIPYGDFSGDTVDFLDVTENSAEVGAVYGAPSVAGNVLTFTPGAGFVAQAEDGGVDFVQGGLSTTIVADAGQLINAVTITESGAYSDIGAESISALIGIASVMSESVQYDGQFSFTQEGDGFGSWSRSVTITFSPAAAVDFFLDNQLFASASAGGSAFIDKNSVSIAVSTCPEGDCPPPTGACCFMDGSCVEVSGGDCGAQGGSYQADYVLCGAANCAGSTGACCFDDGGCEVLTEELCNSSGGDYQGPSVTCVQANCPPPMGACCFTNGQCGVVTEEVCALAGGDYQGSTFTCGQVNCPQPPGACCFADGSCQELSEEDCTAAGGVGFQGDMTLCATANCPQPPGACCFADGSCQELTEEDCTAAGGDSFQGDMTMCATANCPQPPGACCFADGSCQELTEEDCTAAGGDSFQGDMTMCATANCPQPPGACCFTDGSCQELTEEACTAAGGDSFQGDMTMCATANCPQPGACCFDDGSCTYDFVEVCDADGGVYQGDNVTCTEAMCPQPGACCFDDGSCTYVFVEVCDADGGVYQGDNVTCAEAMCPQPGACCFDDGSCTYVFETVCEASDGIYQGELVACEDVDCPVFLESVDVAVRDAATGDRVFVRGFRDGTVEHKFFTSEGGYTPWSEVPDPGSIGNGFGPRLEAVEVIALDANALLYIRAFDDGAFEQNIYTDTAGWTGWFDVPHPEADDREESPTFGPDTTDVVESVDVEAFNGLPGARMFVRAWRSGLIEQCIYTPAAGYTPWSEIPPMGDLIDVVEGMADETIESVQVTAEGGVFGRRIFVIGLRESRRVYQNIYAPMTGYSGWTRVRNGATAALGANPLSSVDVQSLGDGAVLYLRGRDNGRVDQNIYTRADGFSGFERLTATSAPGPALMESCCVELIDPGYFGARIYLRCFDDGAVEQSFFTPGGGQTGWEVVPGG